MGFIDDLSKLISMKDSGQKRPSQAKVVPMRKVDQRSERDLLLESLDALWSDELECIRKGLTSNALAIQSRRLKIERILHEML